MKMDYDKIIVGHRVLIQSGAETKEHALVKGFNDDNVIVRLSDGRIIEINPQYILKDFGA